MDEYISKTELLKVINADVAEADNERCVQLLNAILYVPTANVVPKSEVAELEIKLRRYEQVCGKLAIKDGVAVGLIDGKETVYILKSISKVTKELAVRRTKVEVSRVIFEEIETCMKNFEDDDDGYLLKKCEFEFFMRELKKKYTEEKE